MSLKRSVGLATLLKKSLKWRFTAYLGLPILLATSLLLLACVLFADEEIQEIYDTQLAQTAQVAGSMLRHDIADGNVGTLQQYFTETHYEYEKYVALRIWKQEQLLLATQRAEALPATMYAPGFSDQHYKNTHYRVFALDDAASGLHIEALQDVRARWDMVRKIMGSIVSPILLFMLCLPALLWFGLKFGLQPLDQLSLQVARRSANDLEPIKATYLPEEVSPLVNALNTLLMKMNHSITTERQFTNLAAHELRTPLAVIQTQLDAVIRDPDEQSRRKGLQSLAQSVNRATQMIQQLLSLARLGGDNIPLSGIMLDTVAREVATTLSPLALKKDIALSYEADESLMIEGNDEVLEIAIRNMIDNAIKYTPQHGTISLVVRRSSDYAEFAVIDSGAGIQAEHLALVTERFYRIPGNRAIGSGLGLSIVRRAAEIMKGRLVLENREDGSGLIAALQFPVRT